MSSSSNNFSGATFDYLVPENNGLGLTGYAFDVTNGGPSTCETSGSYFDTSLAGLSTQEIVEWWLGPKSDCRADQYAGSTLLDCSRDEFAGPYDSQIGDAPGSNGFNSDYGCGFDAFGQQHMDASERAGPSTACPPMAYPSTVPYLARPTQLPSPPSATFTGPAIDPPPVPTLSWGYSPLPTTSYMAAGNDQPRMSDRPLAEPSVDNQWPYQTSVGKGKARAADHFPPFHPSTTGDTMWQCQQPYALRDCDAGSNPQMGASALNTDLSTQVAPSTGPRRSVKRAKGKGKETDKAEGRRKRIPKKNLAPGINWPNTCERFCAEMAKIYYSQPTGEVINPEMAYAKGNKFVKEDLHLSPLVVKLLGERSSRDVEQYLIGILNELRPRTGGQKRGVRYMLERVAQELENELVVVNDDFALQSGPPNEINPEGLDASEEAVKQRTVERARREGIRTSLERMSLFFKIPEPKHLWTRPQTLFFATTYLVFGARVFGDGGEFFTPKPQL